MDDYKILIQPATLTKTEEITNIKINIMSLELFKSVTIVVSLLNNNDNIIDNKIIKLEGNDYLNWNNDDNYIKNIVISKLGYTLLE
jgi:hypothetical protein